jgi:hypothetical protein
MSVHWLAFVIGACLSVTTVNTNNKEKVFAAARHSPKVPEKLLKNSVCAEIRPFAALPEPQACRPPCRSQNQKDRFPL